MLLASIVTSSVKAEHTVVEASLYTDCNIQERIDEALEEDDFYNLTNEESVENNVSSEDDWVVDKINEIREATGLNVIGFEKHTFELSFYSDLNCENGYGQQTTRTDGEAVQQTQQVTEYKYSQ